MLRDRVARDKLAARDLTGTDVTLAWRNDRRTYSLVEKAGEGATAVAWKAVDATNAVFALKFVPRSDYNSHSLDAELSLAASLPRDLFAIPVFYGIPTCDANEPEEFSSLYAVVVEWISGPTLSSFLSNAEVVIDPTSFLTMARDLCSALESMRRLSVCHSDLHDRNIIVASQSDHLTGSKSYRLCVIDTGQLKSEELRARLLESWRSELSVLEGTGSDDPRVTDEITQRNRLIDYFGRTDQEWVVCQLAQIFNKIRHSNAFADPRTSRFLADVPVVLKTMIDPDRSRRLSNPQDMYDALVNAWRSSANEQTKLMQSPFDLLSAELIRSDEALMALFSEEYPSLDACRGDVPLYLYGPRGCGKSTVLRSVSIGAILASESPKKALEQVAFFGIYIPVAAEMRSRFWLIPESDFALLEGHIVRYFSLLLLESLIDGLMAAKEYDSKNPDSATFEFDDDSANAIVVRMVERIRPEACPKHFSGTQTLLSLKTSIRLSRFAVWQQILDKEQSPTRTDAQLVFDACDICREILPFLQNRRVCFLIDDYSNQRIPASLQRRLNQAITFSRQASAMFKVSSEYDGVDLEGVEQGREVVEVNIGLEYVSLAEKNRHLFLQSVLERRFLYLEIAIDISAILGKSGLGPAIPLARHIRQRFADKQPFYYYGIDTISDLCSGDFAMGVQLVRRIFARANVDWHAATKIPEHVQHDAISEYTTEEYEHLQYHTLNGRTLHEIADRLAWLSRECVLAKTFGRKSDPVVKNHVDIAESALSKLINEAPALAERLADLVRRGVLFPLEHSRARQGRDGTRRFMLRRILLARYPTALGRHTPIRVDDVERLKHLLTDPSTFVTAEVARTGVNSTADLRSSMTQSEFPFDETQ